MKTKLISLDTSSKASGWAYFEDGKLIKHGVIDLKDDDDSNERTKEMCKQLLYLLNGFRPEIIAIEDTWNARNVQTTKLLSRICGVVYGWAIEHNCMFELLLPSEWRKLCNIDQSKKKRAELKQASIDYVNEKLNVVVSDDEADAVCIGWGLIEKYNKIKG